MGREIRRVHGNWKHPRRKGGEEYKPLHEGCQFKRDMFDYEQEAMKWSFGVTQRYYPEETRGLTLEEWAGNPPDRSNYMPDWSEHEKTHIQMYETTSEGTPISPVMETPEELARWLADNNASSFGASTATYEQWLAVCRGGYAPSMVFGANGLRSGVEHMGDKAKDTET